uniref:Uncharacterized protein n=1 Tax=Solanum lycopersicum TaxID=4081 RepID=A0A3Q7II60_SOLLC
MLCLLYTELYLLSAVKLMLHGFQYLVADSSLLLASSVRSGVADMTFGSCAHSGDDVLLEHLLPISLVGINSNLLLKLNWFWFLLTFWSLGLAIRRSVREELWLEIVESAACPLILGVCPMSCGLFIP